MDCSSITVRLYEAASRSSISRKPKRRYPRCNEENFDFPGYGRGALLEMNVAALVPEDAQAFLPPGSMRSRNPDQDSDRVEKKVS